MAEQELRVIIREELAPIREELTRIRTSVDGLPFINRAITGLQHDSRALRAAINDFAHTNVTSGEVEALHSDVNKAQADYMELATRLATLERRLDALEKR